MGVVYLAACADEPDHIRVAIKVVASGFDVDEADARFRREPQIRPTGQD